MNGRSPTMCVTVLQSQPSVSIPTLTMQRASRPGGCSGLPSFLASSSKPSGRIGRPCLSSGHATLPTVSSVSLIHADSSLLAWSLSVSCTTFESTRIVLSRPGTLRKPVMFAGGMPAGGWSSASHS